jgi:hypothetical protein
MTLSSGPRTICSTSQKNAAAVAEATQVKPAKSRIQHALASIVRRLEERERNHFSKFAAAGFRQASGSPPRTFSLNDNWASDDFKIVEDFGHGSYGRRGGNVGLLQSPRQ